jgi:hypothetical protein
MMNSSVEKLEAWIGGLAIAALLAFAVAWGVNAYKLSQCDFAADYKCEALHGVGLVVPPLSWITVWFGHDSE